jgi:glycosyltransferase involved in cell wall biosynthesis
LCILTQYFPPEIGAPQARLCELGQRLADRGWSVEVLTALPNYPTGKIFPAYRRRKPCVEWEGPLRVARVPLYTAKTGFAKRLQCYFSFVRSATRYGPRLCRRPDLLFVESPPLFIGFAARRLSRVWRCPYVFNVSDLWPESLVHMGVLRPGLITRWAERLELSFYRGAIGVTGQSTGIIASVQRRCADLSTALITNGVDPARFGAQQSDPEARQLLGEMPGPIFIYAGLLGYAQGLSQILDLAKSLPAEIPGRFVLVGDGPLREHLVERIAQESIARVRVLEAQPRWRIPALLAAADAAIISLSRPIPGAVPSKIYEAMASSLPVLLIADGEPARRLQEAGAGLCVPPREPEALYRAFVQLAGDAEMRRDRGAQGRLAAETLYHRDRIADHLDAFLSSHLPPDANAVAVSLPCSSNNLELH